jgi:purine-binding chemotaxis protein CheW
VADGERREDEARRPTANPADPLRRALDEFFVQADDPEQAEPVAPDIHQAAAESDAAAGVRQYLSFRLNDELYAVGIGAINEIIKPGLFTQVPRTEPVILGVLSLRGNIVPVVDLRLLLGLDELPQTRRSRVLIVEARGERVGLLVDEVRSVIRLLDESIEPPPPVFDRLEAEHMLGLGRFDDELYTLLDLESVVQLDRYIHKARGGRGR